MKPRVAFWPFAISTIFAAFLVALVRASFLHWQGTLPVQYLLHGVLANFLIAVLAGGVMLPFASALLILPGVGSRTTARMGWLLAPAAMYLPFALLTSPQDLVGASIRIPLAETVGALPVSAGLTGAAWLLYRGKQTRILGRTLVVTASLAMGMVTFVTWSIFTDPATRALDTTPSARRMPPIFLILIDTLRADHLGAYGYSMPTSPHVDALAVGSTVYTRALAQAPWTRV